jgi:hypothetical protein
MKFNIKKLKNKPDKDQVTENTGKKEQFIKNKPKPTRLLFYFSLVCFVLAIILTSAWGLGGILKNQKITPTATELLKILTQPASPKVAYATVPANRHSGQGGMVQTPEILSEITPTHGQRKDIMYYTVVSGDTIFGIADKFGLLPETVLWANRYTLGDTPDGLAVGDQLVILPEDGVYHMWSEGEGLNGVSNFYGVDPDVIVDYPLNKLDRSTLGDLSLPNIPPGTMLVVPGGRRPTVTWIVARENPAEGSAYLGPGVCPGTYYGAVGTGTFVFPTVSHALSGYDWNPPVHNGLDFEGRSGSPIFAADSGVVVYSGWSDRGYGNLLVVDHDGGWQTMYAHLLDGSFVPCGTNVYQGDQIGLMGSTGNSTGPHLHFELRYNGSAVNPWNYLQ